MADAAMSSRLAAAGLDWIVPDWPVPAHVHAGWRGLAAGVIEAAVDAMSVAPASLLAWLGPAIGPRAFEVGADVYAAFCDADPAATTCFVAGSPGKHDQ